ncbi:type II toxin-antitoxin system HipA family toxin [Microbacterium sp. 1.5R]|uniref:type II toxin-antitoxin system HipA family toxin n=1 Tax=Microbacterium sp. 1.5R TaxID=1916917 RepID=UPI00119CAB34|nr:type II toxin-antitoxin system HipA family toxin [Microbacterium sp. 1.5R]
MRLDLSVVLPSGDETPAGTVDDTGGVVAFEYSRDYLAHPDSYALAPSLPLGRGEFLPAGTRPMLAGLADAQPDTWGRRLMQSIERRATGRYQHLSELDVLRRVGDAERLGALRVSIDGEYQSSPDDKTARLADLPELIEAARAFERGEEISADKLTLLQAGTSMGGARPKATVLNSYGRLAIAKLPARDDFGDAMAWEATCLELARRSGVKTPRFEHHRFEYNSVLVVERFDRREGQRQGYLSADGMLNRSHGEYIDYVRLASALQKHSASADADSAELFRRVALTLLVNNVDDHMRNHGFLRERNGWRLAPAFDINPFSKLGTPESTRVSPDDDPSDRDIRLLREHHDAFRLTEPAASDIIAQVETATADWREVALGFGIAPEALGTMSDAFDGPNRRRAREFPRRSSDASTPLGPDGSSQPRDRAGRFDRKDRSTSQTLSPRLD